MNLFREFIGKLDSTWGRLTVISLFVIAGYQIGMLHENVIKTKELNDIENRYNTDKLNLKEKYINENIVLNRKISELELQNNLLKTKYEQDKDN